MLRYFFRKTAQLILISIFIFCFFSFKTNAIDCGTDLQCQIDTIQREIDALTPAHEKNKTDLSNLRTQITSLNKKIN